MLIALGRVLHLCVCGGGVDGVEKEKKVKYATFLERP